MSISDWGNKGSLVPPYVREEQNPYSLPIILRLEKTLDTPTHEEALLATAKGIALLFDSDKVVNNSLWYDSLTAWMNGRIRKVTRRARASAWEKVYESDTIYSKYGNAEICILPPHPIDETPELIRKLQVANLELHRTHEPVRGTANRGLSLAVNPDLNMTTGKSMAQIGHATQLAIFNSSIDTLNAWKAEKFSATLTSWDATNVWTAEVQDAGFTEIPEGSFTTRSLLQY